MMITLRRARSIDATALPAIERSAAELFRCDPSLAWLADAQVTDAEQHRRAIETDEGIRRKNCLSSYGGWMSWNRLGLWIGG